MTSRKMQRKAINHVAAGASFLAVAFIVGTIATHVDQSTASPVRSTASDQPAATGSARPAESMETVRWTIGSNAEDGDLRPGMHTASASGPACSWSVTHPDGETVSGEGNPDGIAVTVAPHNGETLTSRGCGGWHRWQ